MATSLPTTKPGRNPRPGPSCEPRVAGRRRRPGEALLPLDRGIPGHRSGDRHGVVSGGEDRVVGYDWQDKRRRIAERERGPSSDVDWYLYEWEADFPNEVWLVDSTPSIWLAAGPGRKKPVHLQLVHIIDDHSRLIVGGGFTERLRVEDLLRFLCPALRRHGCPSKLYVDRASIHRSAIIVNGIARLGGRAVLGTRGHGPGHGKVERLHQEAMVLEEDLHLSPVTTVEDACRYYDIWRERSALEVHGVTGEAPLARWERILGNARIPGEDELLWAFRGETEATIDTLGRALCRAQGVTSGSLR
jgi:transposase InsO family protein